MKFYFKYLGLIFSIFLISCTDNIQVESSKDTSEYKLFNKVPISHSGLNFNNFIQEDYHLNHIRYDVIFQGGGVALGDINNDGLLDIFMVNNKQADKLYLNKGGMKFQDITATANLPFDRKWSSGVTMADVNSDGFLDIYVCKFLLDSPESKENKLYINNGDLTFTEKAKEYGIADPGYSSMANFFDYDKDGDLDLYVANQPPVKRRIKKKQLYKVDYQYTDRLYRNNGNGTFTDVTSAAGITNYNFALSVTVSDMNNDTWLDVYVASDYEEPDAYYQNNGDGTFTNVIDDAMRHLSTFSMGVDIADINNDGWMDLYVADMVAADNQRLKSNMSGMNPDKFWSLVKSGYHHQYMFNTFQINNGNGSFSEIGQMAGVSHTDWSWATLFADYDNDGFKDLIVTNGLMKDLKNNDYQTNLTRRMDSLKNDMISKGQKVSIDPMLLIDLPPSEKLHNYVFKNNGDLTFDDLSLKWGLEDKTWTNGAAYGDLDNDGDIDVVMNNMNDYAGLYENQTVDLGLNNYIRIKLTGDQKNRQAIGARAWIYYKDQMQVQELSPVRGYYSRNEEALHFGIGNERVIDKVIVRWPDGKGMTLTDVKANKVLNLDHKDAKENVNYPTSEKQELFSSIESVKTGIDFIHTENEFNDFKREILLPYRMSHLGPAVEAGDINNDGKDDFFIGGSSGQAGALFYQTDSGNFEQSKSRPWTKDAKAEDVGILFFDADNDKDLDLYVSSGGNDFSENDPALQDRIYLNDGNGNFSKANILPKMLTSSSKAKANDFDNDGDMDLFVGGRQVPGKYGVDTRSYLLKNEGGKFVDITEEISPSLVKPGMVTDALWTDFDNDQDNDLIVIGEWMPITLFQNTDGKFTDVTTEHKLENTNGWWNTIEGGDFDNDGDMDYVLGNLGSNIKYKASEEQPFKLYVKDFDENGSHDVYLAYYDGDGVCYPVRGRECSSQQLPFVKKEFPNYNSFSLASVDQVLGERKNGAVEKQAKIFESVYLENLGGSNFAIKKLPNPAQVSPIYGIGIHDWNDDGFLDILAAGNFYEREVETQRSDAGTGVILLGDGKGNFDALNNHSSGLNAYKDVRDVEVLNRDSSKPIVLIANNNAPIELYQKN